MSGRNSPFIPGFWKDVPNGTSGMPKFILQTVMYVRV
jgi:hypothetical protein